MSSNYRRLELQMAKREARTVFVFIIQWHLCPKSSLDFHLEPDSAHQTLCGPWGLLTELSAQSGLRKVNGGCVEVEEDWRWGSAETLLTLSQDENHHKAVSHTRVFGHNMISTLFFLFIFNRKTLLSDTVQHKEQQHSNKYTTHQGREVTCRR